MLKNTMSSRSKTFIACCDDERVYVYILHDKNPFATITVRTELMAMVFLSQYELVLATTNGIVTTLSIYDTTSLRCTKSIEIGDKNVKVKGLEARQNCVLVYSLHVIGKWNTLTNTYESIDQDYPVEFCFINQNEFIMCSFDDGLEVMTISPFQRKKKLPAKPISVHYTDGGAFFIQSNMLMRMDLESGRETIVMEINNTDIAYLTRIVDHKVALVFEHTQDEDYQYYFCSIYNMVTKELEMKEAFRTLSTTYKPFVIKGSLAVYYEDHMVRVFDVASMRQVYEIKGKFAPYRADVAVW
jgi:WD40 repeat protein